MVSMFERSARCSAIGIAYNASNALFAGTAPFIQSYLVATYSQSTFMVLPGVYIAAVALIAFCVLHFVDIRKQIYPNEENMIVEGNTSKDSEAYKPSLQF